MPKKKPLSLDTLIEQYGLEIEVIVYLPHEDTLYDGETNPASPSIPISLTAIDGSKFRRHIIDDALLGKLREQHAVPSIDWATDIMVLLKFDYDAPIHVSNPKTKNRLSSAITGGEQEPEHRVYSLDRSVFNSTKNRNIAAKGHRPHEERLLIDSNGRSSLICIRAAIAEEEDKENLLDSIGRINDRTLLLDLRVRT